MARWENVRFDTRMVRNLDEALRGRRHWLSVENAIYNEAGGHSRFPGLKRFSSIDPPVRQRALPARLHAATSSSSIQAAARPYPRSTVGGEVQGVAKAPASPAGSRSIFA